MRYEDLKYLEVPLPEAIAKEKWGGFFENARSRIAAYLDDETTDYALRCRLEMELGILQNLQERYTLCPEEALLIMQEKIPVMTAEELEKLRMEDKADWIYINGQVRYLDSFAATLCKAYPEVWSRTEAGDTSDYTLIEDYIHSCEDNLERTAHIHIRHEVEIAPRALREGETIRVHIPIPRERAGITNFKMLRTSHTPSFISDSKAAQPTIYFEEIAAKGQVFSVEYELDYTTAYHKLETRSEADMPQEASTACEEAFSSENLMEEAPHIRFTPHLVTLCEKLIGGEVNPLRGRVKLLWSFFVDKLQCFLTVQYVSAFS